MRKTNGFTLIELLAVIVILAIIAIIAVPQILGVVEKSRKSAAESSALGYIDAVEKQMMINELATDKTKITSGVYDVPMASTYGVKVKGQAPTSGWLEIANNKVERYSFVIGKYVVSYDGTDKTTVKGDTANEKPSGSSPVVTIKKDICPYEENHEFTFDYTGSEQTFTVPCSGNYKIEVWGAQGGRGYYGSQSAAGGKGGYAVGTNYLYTGVKMYINSGGKGEDGVMPSYSQRTISAGGYNGGGKGYNYYPGDDFGCGGGGGATHIALVSGELKNLSSHATDGKILIVAGGGGGGSLSWYESGGYRSYAGGAAGGVSGESGAAWSTSYKVGTGGNQSTAGTGYSSGSFGLGGEGTTAGGAGGGAGYYGGGGSGIWASAGGGSGYLSSSLTDSSMENGTNEGNGYAKITYLGK